MTKPPAILAFERAYAASILVWSARAALSWTKDSRMIAADPALIGYEWLVPLGFAAVLLLSLWLLWQVGWRRNAAAAGLVIASAALSALVMVLTVAGLVTGRAPVLVTALLSLVASALNIWAATRLRLPDARAWLHPNATALS